MSFVDNIPKYVKQLNEDKNALFGKRANINWGSEGHECDCEYCDRQGEDYTEGDPDAQKKADKIDAQIKQVDDLIAKLVGDKPSLITAQLPPSQKPGRK